MSSSNNDYNNGNNNNGGYHLSLYLSSLPGTHQDIIRNSSNHQFTASPGQMVSAVPDSLAYYMAFNSNNAVNQQSFEFPEVSRENKKAVKKDRHSKIHTAQGLRDRRVRLSVGIARQFFDLQDMLGFDKASKTLDWLLRKSRKAIKEVVQAKKLNNDDEGIGNNGEDVEEEGDEDENDDGNNSFVNGSSPEYCKEEVLCDEFKKRKTKSELSNISSERSRAKAKGKAKEKASEMVYDHPETVSDITQSEIMDPFNRSITFNEGEDMTHSFYKKAIEEFDSQKSILTEREVNLPTNMGQSYNQHNGTFMLIDEGSTSNYNTIDLPQILDYNYDPNPFDDQTFCAVTDKNFPRGFL